jgi:uncharacterized protein (TIGR02145 family)
MCPAPWRVPTSADFVALDICLGGTGNNRSNDEATVEKYLNNWGGSYGGNTNGSAMINVGLDGTYWSAMGNSYLAYSLVFNSGGTIYPQNSTSKYYGMQVRCVK